MQNSIDVTDHIISGDCKFDFIKKYGLIRTHCCYCDGELLKMSTFSVVRRKELEALCSQEVKNWINKNNIELINFDLYFEEHNGN